MRKIIIHISGTLLLILSTAIAASDLLPITEKPRPSHPPILLADKGEAKITLCVMNVPTSSITRLAMQELKSCFKAIFGAELPVSYNKIVPGPAIVVGACAMAKAEGLDGNKMPIEGFSIKSTPIRIFITGHDNNKQASFGTAWGIYEFIERVLDVRWYWPEQHGGRTLTPRNKQVVPPMWVEDAPVYRKRQLWPSHLAGLLPLHKALRSGNSWPVTLTVHAPHKWGPIFHKERPEIFQLAKGGKRDPKMLCYGNPQTLQTYLEVIDRHEKGIKQTKEEKQIINGNSITVSPWDVGVACHCQDCRALWNSKGGAFGSASLILETFVKKLAVEVKKRWPEKVIIYLPYLNYTLASGKITFPDNVEVQICGMPGLALYKEPSVDKQFQSNIDLWSSLTQRKIQTWEYSCWPEDRTKAPYQYPHVLKNYYLRNRDKIVGSFINGVTDHWPRSNFSLYCWLKLLWNPEFNVDAAADEACKRLFGPAARPMRQLFALQSSRWEKVTYPNGILAAQSVYSLSFPQPIINQMKALLAEAKTLAADNPLILKRIAYYETPFPEFYREYEFVVEGKGMTPLLVKKVADLPTIDGKLDDTAWQQAPPASFKTFKKGGAKPAKFPTELRAVWMPKGLVFGFRMTEPNPKALQKEKNSQDDGGLYWQDCIELYLDPTGTNEGNYFHLLLTAGLAKFDAKKNDTAWHCKGLQFATHIDKNFWSMEVFVPCSAIEAKLNTGATGVKWFGQFTRHRLADKVGGRENQKLNADQGGFNSNTGDFGEVRFIE